MRHLPECNTHWAKSDRYSCICKYLEKASRRTEQHIIKLLEEQKATHEEKIAVWFEASLHRYQELELAIALIKGEQKMNEGEK